VRKNSMGWNERTRHCQSASVERIVANQTAIPTISPWSAEMACIMGRAADTYPSIVEAFHPHIRRCRLASFDLVKMRLRGYAVYSLLSSHGDAGVRHQFHLACRSNLHRRQSYLSEAIHASCRESNHVHESTLLFLCYLQSHEKFSTISGGMI
jgi:hypothetical protein